MSEWKPQSRFAALRQMAADMLDTLPMDLGDFSPDEKLQVVRDLTNRHEHVSRLMHELHVHQLELDIQYSELERTRDVLQHTYDRYAELYNHAPVAYFTTSTSGTILEANATAARLLGVVQGSLFGQPLTDFIVPEDQDTYYFHRRHLAEKQLPHTCELGLQRSSGSLVHVRIESIISTDEEGAMQYWSIVSDISERVRAETALRQANEALEQRVQERTAELRRALDDQRFLSNVSDHLIAAQELAALLQQVGHLVLEYMADICIVTLPTETGEPDLRLVAAGHPAQEQAVRAWMDYRLDTEGTEHPLQRVLAGDQTIYLSAIPTGYHHRQVVGEAHNIRQCDVHVHINSSMVVPLVARGRTIGALSLFIGPSRRQYTPQDLALAEELAHRIALAIDNAALHDATQQARASAEAAVQMRDQVLRMVSHDMKNPINSIQGSVSMLQYALDEQPDNPKTEEIGEYADIITEATEQMICQLDELLDTVQLQAGQMLTLNRESVDMVALVRRVVATCQPLRQRHPIEIEPAEAQVICQSDAQRMERVLTNMLINAIKYSPDGGTIRITLQPEVRERGDGIAIAISDEGMGIPAHDLPHIFEPFRRGSNTTPRIPGSGLGLAGARAIVEQHGGTITATSEEGNGSTFTIWLPLIAF